ncbi:MAG TPA: globin [Nannocystis exedens]|nr:globin [Nannocystis exedens]
MTDGILIPYEAIGGADATRQLSDRFYDLMDSLPEAKLVRSLHPADLTMAREKLFEFLSGWLGGPQLYIAKYGHPRLRMRHARVPIGPKARDQWMLCMRAALAQVVDDEALRASLERAFAGVADHMRNREFDEPVK